MFSKLVVCFLLFLFHSVWSISSLGGGGLVIIGVVS